MISLDVLACSSGTGTFVSVRDISIFQVMSEIVVNYRNKKVIRQEEHSPFLAVTVTADWR